MFFVALHIHTLNFFCRHYGALTTTALGIPQFAVFRTWMIVPFGSSMFFSLLFVCIDASAIFNSSLHLGLYLLESFQFEHEWDALP